MLSVVPEGSVLIVLLFIITIRDFNSDIKHSRVTSFDDGTRILYHKV